jgi:hyaluronan synthase
MGMFVFVAVLMLLVSTVLRFILSGLAKLRTPGDGITRDFTVTPSISILLPCFNEGSAVYSTIESLCRSNYPKDRIEIVAIDDCSADDSYDWITRAQRDFPDVRITALQNARNRGKSDTQSVALRLSHGDIIMCVDSDATFDPDAIRELAACFSDPHIGAAGGVVGVRNLSHNIYTSAQALVYALSFHVLKSFETQTKSVLCLSGCIMAVRRDLFMKIDPRIHELNFFGIDVRDGEDLALSHMVQLEGYGTIVNTRARCVTDVPDTFDKLWNQQVRWQRSGVRDFVMTLRTLHKHIWHLRPNPNLLYGSVIPMLSLIVLTILFLTNPLLLFVVAPASLGFGLVLAVLYVLLAKRFLPDQEIKPHMIPALVAFSVWVVVARLITICAVFTLDDSRWMTRLKPVLETANVQ